VDIFSEGARRREGVVEKRSLIEVLEILEVELEELLLITLN
jgi:hypothetical protein